MKFASRLRIFRVGPTDRLIRALAHSVVFRRQAPHFVSWLKDPERVRRRAFEVEFCGFRYRGDLSNHTDWCIYFLANFLGPELDFIKRTAATMRRSRNRFVCYDVGANIGHMTLAMASVADEVVAFDPSPYAIARLQEQISINRISNVRYLNLALGEDDDDVQFEIFSAVNFRAKRTRSAPVEQSVGRFNAAIRHGDETVVSERLPQPNFLRINAGDDFISVLKGLRKTIVSAQPIILIERPKGYRTSIDETSLRGALYPEVALLAFETEFSASSSCLEALSEETQQILCLPAFIPRMAEQELAKARSQKLAD